MRNKKNTVAHPLEEILSQSRSSPKHETILRNNSHQSGAEKKRNQSNPRLGDWLVRNSGICGSRGSRRVGASTRGSGLGACGCGCGGRIESSVAEDIVIVAALAGEAGLELVDILALSETVDAAVVVVLGDLRVLAALIHHISHVPTDNGRTGCVGRGDLPDTAAAGSAGRAHGRGGGGSSSRHFELWRVGLRDESILKRKKREKKLGEVRKDNPSKTSKTSKTNGAFP
jgi:hypothetical protein